MDAKTIKHVAVLARLNLNEKEEEKLKTELSSILSYIEKLNQVNTDNVNPPHQITGLVNSTRSDEGRGDFVMNEDLSKKLIDQAPDKQNRFIKVKSVLKK